MQNLRACRLGSVCEACHTWSSLVVSVMVGVRVLMSHSEQGGSFVSGVEPDRGTCDRASATVRSFPSW